MRHVVFILLAAVCFGTTGTAQEFGPDGASALSVGATRIVIGGGALALVAWLATRVFRRGAGESSPAQSRNTRDSHASTTSTTSTGSTGSIPIAPEGAVATHAILGRTSAPT